MRPPQPIEGIREASPSENNEAERCEPAANRHTFEKRLAGWSTEDQGHGANEGKSQQHNEYGHQARK